MIIIIIKESDRRLFKYFATEFFDRKREKPRKLSDWTADFPLGLESGTS
jgi:hypothetical protein